MQHIADGVTRLIKSIFDPKALNDMVVEEKTSIQENKLNENFHKAEFQALWKEINHQYVYTVNYDSNELIEKAILHINSGIGSEAAPLCNGGRHAGRKTGCRI